MDSEVPQEDGKPHGYRRSESHSRDDDGAGLVVILTHERADFDAISSQVGMARLLPGSLPVLPMIVNDNVRDFLVLYGRELPLIDREAMPRGPVVHAWFVDTTAAQAVRGMSDDTPRSLVDHHAPEDGWTGDGDRWAERDVQAVGATATLVVERLRGAGVVLPPIEATMLLLGIHEDSGSLTFAATTARDARAVAWLMDAGADVGVARRFLNPPLSPEAEALYHELHNTADRRDIDGCDVVVAAAMAPGFAESVAGLVQRLASTMGPDAVLALIDLGTHVQFVGRSATEDVDVGAAAEEFGGGGHPRAAAAVVRSSLEDAVARLDRLLASGAITAPSAKVADIMSKAPIQTFSPDDTVAYALERARRHGHEGYPVVEDDRVVGLVTRATLDLALHHHLQNRRLRQLLAAPPPVVSPEDSLHRLHRVMTRHDVGQVPVVAEGRLVGIVTRTDVLAQQRDRSMERHTTAVQVDLTRTIDPEHLAAIQDLERLARERGQRAYLVGGMPRDLLLEREARSDVDLVIVGDATSLAETAANLWGGRAVRHGRFGTANWRNGNINIDLTTARAEYYAEPGALPTVSAGSLRADLRRRDFTINALAIDLDSARFGRVIDLFGGLEDLRAKRIRVMHGLSFVEDPTRILRAVRFERRLGFALDDHTQRLARGAVSWLGTVSGARVANELRYLFNEPDFEGCLARLEDLGVLAAIHPSLGYAGKPARTMRALQGEWEQWREHREYIVSSDLPEEADAEVLLLVWLAAQGDGGFAAAERLDLTRRQRKALDGAKKAAQATRSLPLDAIPSAINRAFETVSPLALTIASLTFEEEQPRYLLQRYVSEIAPSESPIDGDDLRKLGGRPGPSFRVVLRAVQDAWLDGDLSDRAAALDLAQRMLNSEPDGHVV